VRLLTGRWIFKIDNNETYAAVCRYESLRLLLALIAIQKLDYKQFGVKTAFLNGTLDEEIGTSRKHGR